MAKEPEATEAPKPKRPAGLIILAAVNVFLSLSYVMMATAPPTVRDELPQLGSASKVHAIATALLLLVSALGFLQLSRRIGFLLGNVTGVWLVGSAVVLGFVNQNVTASVPTLIYSTALLIALNVHYKTAFVRP
jgi:hypothetical protein